MSKLTRKDYAEFRNRLAEEALRSTEYGDIYDIDSVCEILEDFTEPPKEQEICEHDLERKTCETCQPSPNLKWFKEKQDEKE